MTKRNKDILPIKHKEILFFFGIVLLCVILVGSLFAMIKQCIYHWEDYNLTQFEVKATKLQSSTGIFCI